ncbi:MAG: hypothetical protein J5854_06365 [Clostridia bacterium]|nr:hypothetical protein [Clostridia bacterium]
MKACHKITAALIALAMLACLSACKPNEDLPVPTEHATTEPAVTEPAATEPAPTAPAEPLVFDADPAAIRGHYILLEGGTIYDLDTGMFVMIGVKNFVLAAEPRNVNIAVLDDGSLWGWHETEPEVSFGDLMDLEYHPDPVRLLEGIAKAEAGCALTVNGELIVWGYNAGRNEWENADAARRAELLVPRTVMEDVKDFFGDCALKRDGTLVRFGAYAANLADAPEEVDTDVKEMVNELLYLKNDGSLCCVCRDDGSPIDVNVTKTYMSTGSSECFYIDAEGNLHSAGVLSNGEHPAILEGVERVVFDRVIGENAGYSYAFAFTADGWLWYVDDYYNEAPRRIASDAKDVWSDGVNTYVLMNDGSLWAYTVDETVAYVADLTARPDGEFKLVKILDGVIYAGVKIETASGDEFSPSYVRSVFYAFVGEARIFTWGYTDGETAVTRPYEICLMKQAPAQ